MFFTSVRVLRAVTPSRRTDTLASTRRLPFSMSQSEMPMYSSSCLSVSRYARASAGERRSGPPTISMSGTPERFRSTAVAFGKRSWIDLPASSSTCNRTMVAFTIPRSGEMNDSVPFVASGWSCCEI